MNNSPLNFSLTSPPETSTFTDCYDFQRHISQHITPLSVVRLMTYNIGLTDSSHVASFVASLCKASRVQILSGFNPRHEQNTQFLSAYRQLLTSHPNLQIRLREKAHGKLILIGGAPSLVGWTGSLNLIQPHLFDIMVRLSVPQSALLTLHFDKLWQSSTVLLNN